jgi:hydroxymethylbilane synthase
MRTIRVGTRGSDLALWQTRWVCQQLRERFDDLAIEEVIIKTHGDQVVEQNFGPDWPVGAFVSALERALVDKEVDFAVHSFKDLQTAETAGLAIAAVPPRVPAHDVLLTNGPMRLDDLPAGAKIGTNSPRRAAQLQQRLDVEIIPVRGNLPTRVAKIQQEKLDGVMLAAAGLDRLGLQHPHRIDLSMEDMLPAPAQGALAIQCRERDELRETLASLDDARTRRCVIAERSFLATIQAGCHTPVAAFATLEGDEITLRARLFSDDLQHLAAGDAAGEDPKALGRDLALRLKQELVERCGSG